LIDAQPILRAICVRDTGFEFKSRYIVTTSNRHAGEKRTPVPITEQALEDHCF
jgi:hypothetical protein